MRDVDIEPQLRSTLRMDAEALPFTITPTELERRLAMRRRARDGRRMSVVAAGVAVVAMGGLLALGAGWQRMPSVGQSSPAAVLPPPSSPETTNTAAPSATTADPSASEPPEGGPLACEPLDPGQRAVTPPIVLTRTPDAVSNREGLTDSFVLGRTGTVAPTRWILPDDEVIPTLPPGRPDGRLSFVVAGPEDVIGCFTHLTVDAARIDASGSLPLDAAGQPTGGTIRLADVDTDRAWHVFVDKPPVGGHWVVRAFATFATTSGTAQSVTFYLVDTRDPGASAPSPSPSPTAAPSSLASLPPPTGTRFVDRDETNSGAGGPLPVVDGTADFGQLYDLGELPQRPTYTVTMACLGVQPTSWSIGKDGQPGTLTYHDVRCDGLPHTIDVSLGTPTMPLHLFVSVRDASEVSQGSQASKWHIQVSSDDLEPGFIPPALGVSAAPAGSASPAISYLQCLELDGAGAPCLDTFETQYGAPLVGIFGGDGIDASLPAGWTIERIVIDAAPWSFIYLDPSPAGVRPAIWTGTPHASDVRVPLDRVLVPGEWTLRVRITATGEGHTISGWYDVPVRLGG